MKRTPCMLMLLILICMLASAASQHAYADSVFDHPQTAGQLLAGPLKQAVTPLRAARLLRGQFVFRKYLVELPKPLVSRGDFVFARELGVQWHTREPFDSNFILTPKGMSQADNGTTTMQMQASEQPAVKLVAQIFLALLSLDVQSLEQSFSLSGMEQGRQWQVGLKPVNTAIASVFQEAVLSGGAQVQSLQLRDTNGDHTDITFSALQYGAELTAAESALFGKIVRTP